MKNKMKTLLGVLLALTMAVGLLPGMLSTAPALAEVTCPYGHSNVRDLGGDTWYCDDCFEYYDAHEMQGLASGAPQANGYCPYCGSTSFYYEEMYDDYLCTNCGNDFETPSSTPPVHHHDWGYISYGNCIEAECNTVGCPNGYDYDGITLTIHAPSSLVCDGSPKAATISGSIPAGQELPSPSAITYNPGGSNAPTTPGTYTASFSWGGANNASVTFTLTASAHTHSWSYQANGSTVTASCGQGCDITEGLSITISAPSGTLTYDGNGKAASLSTGYNTTAFPGSYSISYTKNGSPVSGTPTEAGTYTASFTVGTATGSVNYTINKADPIANAPTGLTATYGQTLANVSLSNPSGNTAGTWAWTNSETSVGSAGSHTFTADFTPSDTTNYNSKSNVNVAVTVNKADPIANAPTGLTATYGQTLANVSLSNAEGNTPGTWAWTNSATSVGNAGSHTFTADFTPSDTANYNSKTNVDVAVTVNKADPIANAPDGFTATYGQSLSEFALSNPNGNTPGTWAWADSAATVGNAGKNAIQANFTPDDAANYNTASADVDVTVQRKDVMVTANSKSKTEGEADPALTATVEGAVGKDRINYNLSRDQGDQAGEYTIHVIVGNNPNYRVSPVNGTFTVKSLAQAAGDAVVVEKGVASIPEEIIDAILATENEGTVSLDMSVRGEEVTEIVLPAALLDKVAEAGDALAITLTEGTLALDAETVASLCKQAGGREVYLKLDIVKEEDLNKAQQEAVKDMEVLAMYEAYILADGQRVEISGDSKATAAVKPELAEGQSESDVRVFALNEAGEMTEVPVTWEEGEAKFDVDSFSKYVVTCDAA